MEPKTVLRRGDAPILALRAKLSGFPTGTEIVTSDGLMPVEHLSAGDRVVTRDGGMQTLRWVESAFVTTFACRVSAGAFGRERPSCDLTLPEGQRIFLRSGTVPSSFGTTAAGIAAWRLADGHGIRRVGPRAMRLFRLGFDRHRTVYADGLEMISQSTPLASPTSRGAQRRPEGPRAGPRR